VIAASSHVNETDLRSLWTEGWNEKLKSNPLSDTLDCLAEILVLPTQETLDRMAEIAKEERAAKAALKSIPPTISTAQESSHGDNYAMIQPRKPSTSPSTPQKRNVSDTSFGGRSPNTTPKKLKKPETHIQQLQNTLVVDILKALYDRRNIPVPWVRGRNLRLFYAP
jgi:hypothetical protein